jgi:hypothetical protein
MPSKASLLLKSNTERFQSAKLTILTEMHSCMFSGVPEFKQLGELLIHPGWIEKPDIIDKVCQA